MKQLRNIADYVSEKVKVANADKRYYISTDNMLPSKEGITETVSFPESGSATQYRKDDVLVSNIRPYFKKIWYAANDGSCSNDVLVFRPKDSNQTDSKFLYYLLAQDIFYEHMMAGANGTKMPRGNKKLIPNFEIPDYDLPTQKRIASILSAYDDLIEVNRKQIKLLEEAAERLYREWFIDLRFPGHETATFDADGLPEGWRKEKLTEDIVPILTGKKDANFGGKEGKYMFFTCGQEPIRANSFSFDTSAVILAGNGDFNVKLYRGKFEAYQRTYVLSPRNMNYLYLLFYCVSDNMRLLAKGARGSTIKFLTKGMIEGLEMYIPSDDVLSMFNANVEPMQLQVETLKSQIANAAEARDLLLPRLMNGEIQL